jgi:hypothetical protein
MIAVVVVVVVVVVEVVVIVVADHAFMLHTHDCGSCADFCTPDCHVGELNLMYYQLKGELLV